MHVVATAGHVDHGKSTLVRALTGMEPDRLAEERRRGLTIELGYAWTTLPSGERLAFVDVPGHERFLGTTLAGVGPAPAVMFVVAADEGWMPQSEEHLVALETLGVRHALLVVTRADLADPAPVMARARSRLAAGRLGGAEALAVSGRTGLGMDELRRALDRLVAALPVPDPGAPVRLWIDRAFSVRGSGTVVTGTLPEGTVAVGDELDLAGSPARVRALECLKEPVTSVSGVARVAVNLRCRDPAGRGLALVSPGMWTYTDLVDARLRPAGPEVAPWERPRHPIPGKSGRTGPVGRPDATDADDGDGTGGMDALPSRLTAHLGSAAVTCTVRPLGGRLVRLRLAAALPLHVGDVLLLRDPGRARGEVRVLAAASVLDVRPPELVRRGAARERAALLAGAGPDATSLLRAHRLLRAAALLAMGAPAAVEPVCGDWHADPAYWSRLGKRLDETVRRYAATHPLEPGMPVEAVRHALGLPERRLVLALVRPPLTLDAGRIVSGPAGLPAPVARAVERLRAELSSRPFLAPEAGRLAELGLGARELAAAVRAGALLRVAEGVVLQPGADVRAAALLARLPQPFTVSEAGKALGTSRRVAVPLLELLDRRGLTQRVDEIHRRCRPDTGDRGGG
ncbi:selenocysteine-specific elongation factor [Streptosporangium becharense]|uniref:Selenocysteine-specific elongation factor n=1 Tax=Streptosporangium becharense TaxID=1816182 RepID=A0A7W9IMW1_9ACTN|nr:SelB C-terminal domain-containing protein [Streptosporangium becharense]MBB2910508.1 selenocysteine-specific elongation factor [Streptosporangium becharense]MBB5823251.1 selenocysteine-specific elongation factor [Streptosporangium becharense]